MDWMRQQFWNGVPLGILSVFLSNKDRDHNSYLGTLHQISQQQNPAVLFSPQCVVVMQTPQNAREYPYGTRSVLNQFNWVYFISQRFIRRMPVDPTCLLNIPGAPNQHLFCDLQIMFHGVSVMAANIVQGSGNAASMMVKVTGITGTSMLFPADFDGGPGLFQNVWQESDVFLYNSVVSMGVAAMGLWKADFLKVPHHGADTLRDNQGNPLFTNNLRVTNPSSDLFLHLVMPIYAIASQRYYLLSLCVRTHANCC